MADANPPLAVGEIEALLEAAPDAGFRIKATAEYRRIASWVTKLVDLDEAAILDFGCGEGIPAASFAIRHPHATVAGFDISPLNTKRLAAQINAQINIPAPSNLSFYEDFKSLSEKKFDLIYCWSVLEHIDIGNIDDTIKSLVEMLTPTGVIFANCEPLYYSPHGSHLKRYAPQPWQHLNGSIDRLRGQVISQQLNLSNAREWQQFLSLNRFTDDDFSNAFADQGLKIVRRAVSKTSIEVPARLARLYSDDALRTVGAQYLLRPAT